MIGTALPIPSPARAPHRSGATLTDIKGECRDLGRLALFGAVSGIAFVAISVALANASTPATRGLVMGGYSTSLYLGLALGSLAFCPVITRQGYVAGFAAGALAGAAGTIIAALCWARAADQNVALLDRRRAPPEF